MGQEDLQKMKGLLSPYLMVKVFHLEELEKVTYYVRGQEYPMPSHVLLIHLTDEVTKMRVELSRVKLMKQELARLTKESSEIAFWVREVGTSPILTMFYMIFLFLEAFNALAKEIMRMDAQET